MSHLNIYYSKHLLIEKNNSRKRKEKKYAEEKFKKMYGVSDAVYEECLKQNKKHTLLT